MISFHTHYQSFVSFDSQVNEGDLVIDFAKYGTVTSARLVRDYKGRSRGFAYIDFQDEVGAMLLPLC